MARKPTGNPMGRPKIEIDLEQLKNLCKIQCTQEEAACWFECSVESIERRVKEEVGITFAEFYEQNRGKGRISLRRKQIEVALSGNPAMLIFLGKNQLGQADKQEITGNMSHTLYAQHSDKELQREAEKLSGIVEPGSPAPACLNSPGASDTESAE